MGKLLTLSFLLLNLVACTEADVKVYSLSELGRMKQVYRYLTPSLAQAVVATDAGLTVKTYTKQFQVTMLDNGSAFVNATVISDIGVITIAEYMRSNEVVDGFAFFDNSSSILYYTVDLSGGIPELWIEADFDGIRENNTPAKVQAVKIR